MDPVAILALVASFLASCGVVVFRVGKEASRIDKIEENAKTAMAAAAADVIADARAIADAKTDAATHAAAAKLDHDRMVGQIAVLERAVAVLEKVSHNHGNAAQAAELRASAESTATRAALASLADQVHAVAVSMARVESAVASRVASGG